MDNLGLGIIDKHTIAIVLLTLVVTQVLFGIAIPIETSVGVTQLFIDVSLFTGLIYLARSIYRLPVSIFVSIVETKNNLLKKLVLGLYISRMTLMSFKNRGKYEGYFPSRKPTTKFQDFLSYLFPFVITVILAPIMVILGFGISVLSFEYLKDIPELQKYKNTFVHFLLNLLDRLGIVVVTVIAALPNMKPYTYKIGIIGVCFMILMFMLRGNFTAIIKDALSKPETYDNDNKVNSE